MLTGENWDDTMIQYTRSHGYVAILYFFSLVIIGVMIFLNLFLAILLENFDLYTSGDDSSSDQSISKSNDQSINFKSLSYRAKDGIMNMLRSFCFFFLQKVEERPIEHSNDGSDQNIMEH